MGCGQSKDEELKDDAIRSRAPTARAAASQPATPAAAQQQQQQQQQQQSRTEAIAQADARAKRAREEELLLQQLEDQVLNVYNNEEESDDEDDDVIQARKTRVLEATMQPLPRGPISAQVGMEDVLDKLQRTHRDMVQQQEDAVSKMTQLHGLTMERAGVLRRAQSMEVTLPV